MDGAPPERVEAATVEMVAGPLLVAFLVGAGRSAGDLVPDGLRLIRLDRRPSDRLDQQPAHRQGLIPNHLRGQTQPGTPRQKAVGRILLEQCRRELRRLQVGRAGHDHPLESLAVPLQSNQLAGQPVQQEWMCRGLPLRPEILGRRHQSRAEVQLPQSVRRHTGGEWMGRIHQPPCQEQTIGRDAGGQRWQHPGDARGYLGPWLIVLSASQNERLSSLVVPHDHGCGDLFPEALMLCLERGVRG